MDQSTGGSKQSADSVETTANTSRGDTESYSRNAANHYVKDSCRKAIYKIFTIQNGIMISKETMDELISSLPMIIKGNAEGETADGSYSSLASIDRELKRIAKLFKESHNGNQMEKSHIESLLRRKAGDSASYFEHSLEPREINHIERFREMRRYFATKPFHSEMTGCNNSHSEMMTGCNNSHSEMMTGCNNSHSEMMMMSCNYNQLEMGQFGTSRNESKQIVNLGEDELSTVYAMITKGKDDSWMIEDDYDSMKISFEHHGTAVARNGGCQPSLCYVHENMIAEIEGYKSRGIFHVKRISLPEIKAHSQINDCLNKTEMKIGVFGKVRRSCDKLRKLIANENFDLLVYSGADTCDNPFADGHGSASIRCDAERQGRLYLPFGARLIETRDRKILFCEGSIFSYREQGIFLGYSSSNADDRECEMDVFLKSVLSQRILNPFHGYSAALYDIPNIIIYSQNYPAVVTKIEGITVVSLPPVEEGFYLRITDQVEIINFL